MNCTILAMRPGEQSFRASPFGQTGSLLIESVAVKEGEMGVAGILTLSCQSRVNHPEKA
jgi:hypothetical protein